MTALQSFLVAVGCLFLSANAFVVPSQTTRATTTKISMQQKPDGSEEWMLGDPQKYNETPNPPKRRGQESIVERYQESGGIRKEPGPPPEEPQYRPSRRFDQNDPFIDSPYGQANDVRKPANNPNEKKGVTYARANPNEWKSEQNEQDAFIHGAYGSSGPGRYGLDINGGKQKQRYQNVKGGSATSDFANDPYGSRGAPGGYGNAHVQPRRERAPRKQSDPQEDFIDGPYGTRNAPMGYDNDISIGGKRYERHRPDKPKPTPEQAARGRYERYQKQPKAPSAQESFMDNHSGSNRMEYQGGPERRPRHPQEDANMHDRNDEFAAAELPQQEPEEESRYERYQKQPRRAPSEQENFVDNHSGTNRMEYQGPERRGRRQERYNPEQDAHLRDRRGDEFVDAPNGSNQMRYEAPPTRTRLERYDPRKDGPNGEGPTNDIVNRNSKPTDFDPRRYEHPQRRTQEQRQYERNVREQRQAERRGMDAQEGWMHDPNGSSFTASQYGHGNDGW